ncbi:MAG: ROK family protein [Chloroflexota bacterium]
MIQQSVDVATERPGRFGPLPDDALDALVTVLDETRFGRSRSRSELVTRTGLGRAIVAQRVGELVERGLVTEGDVGPSTGVISDGHVHGRAQGSAGDVGHISVTDDPSVVCRCGNIGCLEALAGGAALGAGGAGRRRGGPERSGSRPPSTSEAK